MKTSARYAIFLFAVMFLLSCSREKKDWQKANELNTIQDFEQFKMKYPESIFSDSVSKKIEELTFNEIILKNTVNDYNSFLEKYPSGSFTELVRDKILQLELSEALSSKDILRVIEKINSSPESKAIEDFAVTETDSLKIKPKNLINENFVTKVLYSEKKNIIQFIIPPDRVIEYEVSKIFEGLRIIQGDIVGILSLAARGGIQERSSDSGCTLQMAFPRDELLYGLSDILIISKGVYIKISDDVYLYSTDDETKLERIKKPNTYKLISGKAFLFRM